MSLSAQDRFFAKLDKTEACWVWRKPDPHVGGYGRFRLDGRVEMAHRVSYRWFVGEIPTGLELDHLCRNRACVNPAHLEPVTRRENTLRGLAPAVNSAREGGRTHCMRGHEYTPENTWVDLKKNSRYCRTCARLRRAKAA